MADERTTEEIEAEIVDVRARLRQLEDLPSSFSVHGQSVNNRDRIVALKKRLRSLNAELNGCSSMQGPDLVI